MIIASDIRIGNYVWYYDMYMQETAFFVEGILEGYIYNSGLPLSKISCEKANPLILDLYLLQQFGFIQGDPDYGEDENVYSFKYDRLNSIYVLHKEEVFQPLTDTPAGLAPYGLPIVHVHQLQNLFHAITGDELIIFE